MLSCVDSITWINQILFPRPAPPFNTQPEHSSCGKEEYLYFNCKDAKGCVIFCHGNASDIYQINERYKELAQLLATKKLALLLVEYPGYGKSTENACASLWDREYPRMVQHICSANHTNWSWEKCIIIGHSIGTAMAIKLACCFPTVKQLVLMSPFTSIKEAAKSHLGLFSRLMMDRFPNESRLQKVKCQVNILHGTNDVVIPFAHGERLAQLDCSRRRLHRLENTGHNDIPWEAVVNTLLE
jgi:uncharacterized protein